MHVLKTDVLIIGGGAAGLNAALNLKTDKGILVEMPSSNSLLSPWNLMIKDKNQLKKEILIVGNNMNNLELVDTFLDHIEEAVSDLKKMGIKFKKSNIGLVPVYSLPGRKIKEIFTKKIKNKELEIIQGKVTNFLINDSKEIAGIELRLLDNKKARIMFNNLIIGAGGLCGLFQYNTGNYCIDGSILALCYEAGFKIRDIEFCMFHPFLITDRRFPKVLISGEILTKMNYENEQGKPFLSKKVAKALHENKHHYIFPQMVREFYLESLKNKIFGRLVCSENWFKQFKEENEFGYIFKNFKRNEIDKIEIHPAFHFSIGGLAINNNAQTNFENIYAAGEISGGLHGSNRIGGLAVLEGLIFGKLAALNINKNPKIKKHKNLKAIGNLGFSEDLKRRVWKTLGPVKNKENLADLKKFLDNKEKNTSQENFIKKILEICLLRKESIGAFYREDLATPATSAKSSFLEKDNIIFKQV